jgi:hypothetical protein
MSALGGETCSIRRARSVTASLCVALALVLGSCLPREPANALVRTLKETTLDQGRVTRRAIQEVVAGTFREVEGQLRARVKMRRAELREDVHRAAQRRIDDVAAISIAQLESVLEGSVARLDAALREEQAKPAFARDRARELEIAIELSATLASLDRESDRLVHQTAERVAVRRERALALIDRQVVALLADPALALEPAAVARDVLADFEASSLAYDREVVEGLAALERELQGAGPALRAFARGAFGERLGERVAARALTLLQRGERVIGERMRGCRVEAMEALEQLP